jgi:hypothetical protein
MITMGRPLQLYWHLHMPCRQVQQVQAIALFKLTVWCRYTVLQLNQVGMLAHFLQTHEPCTSTSHRPTLSGWQRMVGKAMTPPALVRMLVVTV